MMFILLCWALAGCVTAAPPLKSYNVDKAGISVSGISAGAAFATQMHVAYSSEIMGMGSIAGAGPYYCAQGSLLEAINVCMNDAYYIDVPTQIEYTSEFESGGYIDPVSNLQNSKVYLLHGTYDYTVDPAATPKQEEYYTNYGVDLATKYDIPVGHGMPASNYGVPCDSSSSPYINRCNFDSAYAMMNHIYGNLRKPDVNTEVKGQLLEFDQDEFAANSGSFDSEGGYIYVPSGCSEASVLHQAEQCEVDSSARQECGFSGISEAQCTSPERGCCWKPEPPFFCFRAKEVADECAVNASDRNECGFSGITESQCVNERGCCWKEESPFFCFEKKRTSEECKLHIAFHGCFQGREFILDEYAKNAGYLEVAELNNIILVFPQVIANLVFPQNPNGCWDWWGYEDVDYALKTGTQMQAVKNMINRIRG